MTANNYSRSDDLRRCLRRCALELHPDGEFTALAEEIHVVPNTIGVWIRVGRVPTFQARRINGRFGDELAPMETLCPSEDV